MLLKLWRIKFINIWLQYQKMYILINVYIVYVISDFNGGEIAGTNYKKELQKTNWKEFRIEKVKKEKIR